MFAREFNYNGDYYQLTNLLNSTFFFFFLRADFSNTIPCSHGKDFGTPLEWHNFLFSSSFGKN